MKKSPYKMHGMTFKDGQTPMKKVSPLKDFGASALISIGLTALSMGGGAIASNKKKNKQEGELFAANYRTKTTDEMMKSPMTFLMSDKAHYSMFKSKKESRIRDSIAIK